MDWGLLDTTLLLDKLEDDDGRVRAAAVRILEPQLTSGDESVARAVFALVDDPDMQVTTQLLLSAAQTGAPGSEAMLEHLTARHEGNPNIRSILNHVQSQQAIARKRRLENEFLAKGRNNFEIACMPCHGMDGKGTPAPGTNMTLGAPIAGSPRVTGRMDIPIKIMLKGMTGELDGRTFPGPMLPLESFDDEWIASTLTYIRSHWGNKAPMVTAEDVAAVRSQIKDREVMWDSSEILSMVPVPSKQMRQWRFTSSHKTKEIKSAIDGNPNSRWDTGAVQVPGMWLAFDMGQEHELTSVVLDSRRSKQDYPRQYSVEISDDGEHWSKTHCRRLWAESDTADCPASHKGAPCPDKPAWKCFRKISGPSTNWKFIRNDPCLKDTLRAIKWLLKLPRAASRVSIVPSH